MRKRTWFIVGMGIVVVVGGLFAYRTWNSGEAGGAGLSIAATPAADSDEMENVIWASGELVPVLWATLSSQSGGIVRSIEVAEGDATSAGAVLVELDDGSLASQVDVADATLSEAKANRDRVLAGATASQLAAARADVAAADATIASAQAAVSQAEEAVVVASAQQQIAQAQYAELASHPTAEEVTIAQKEVEVAQAVVSQAQAAYDIVRGDPHIGARPESTALYQATANLQGAQASLQITMNGATAEQLEVARAQVAAAKAYVQSTQAQVPGAEANLQSAQAGQLHAQAALDGLLAGPTPEEKAMAEAQVKSAEAGLAAAQAQLARARVVAPFDGQVGGLFVRQGEVVLPGQSVTTLGQTSEMRVETTDLRETDVVRIDVGMDAEVTFDALPGRAFSGTIVRIAPMSIAEKGSTNYRVTIDVADLDPSLRWGMTAFVNIQID